MAVKSFDRNFRKEKGARTTRKTIQEVSTDEIALRDEILELKRQVMILKRTNEQNLVKFRKYEDEAKRKDRQIEQLMDPRKNSEITKILSTKGAAILMNLKDQNNALIQMILNKDLQIKRLIAEIKMSKLYNASRKNEPYRTETIRLRNLLIKSQEMLKDNINLQQEESRSICVNGNSFLETSSSSDQSSPRELEDLRFTIQSLETHIKYSNDLLARKNQEILSLSEELNTLRKIIEYKTFKHTGEKFEYKSPEFISKKPFSTEPTYQCRYQQDKIFPHDEAPFEITSKYMHEAKLPYSAPSSSQDWIPSSKLSPKHFSLQNLAETCDDWNKKEPETETQQNKSIETKKIQTNNTLRKSLLHNLAAGEVQEEKMVAEKGKNKAKENWKKVMEMFKKNKKLHFCKWGEGGKPLREESHKAEDFEADESDLETHEFEMMEKDIGSDHAQPDNTLKSEGFELSETEGRANNFLEKQAEDEQDKAETLAISSQELLNNTPEQFHQNTPDTDEGTSSTGTSTIPISETHKEVRVVYDNISVYQERETKNVNSLRQVYRQSLDSSFESDNGYSFPEVQRVQVEVEINSPPTDTDSNESGKNSPVKFSQDAEGSKELDDDFNDDDDVIVG